MKALNVVLMVLMALLCAYEVWMMVQEGFSALRMIFALLFGAFAARRFLIMQRSAS